MDIDLYPQPVFIMPDTFEFCPGSSVTINADDYGGPWENFIWGQCGGCVDEFTTSTPGIYDVLVFDAVSYTHLRAHETVLDIVCRLLLEKKKNESTCHGLYLSENSILNSDELY